MGWSASGRFYRQLGVMLKAGLPWDQALPLAGDTGGPAYARRSRAWARACTAGSALGDALAADGEPPLAVALMRAGEASGRLPEVCQELAGWYEHLVALRNQALGRLVYPALLLHVALALLALPGVIPGRLSPWWLLAGPAALWLLLGLGVLGASLLRRGGLLASLALWPGVRFVCRPFVAANLCAVLRAGLVAGLRVGTATDLAAAACGNRVVGARLAAAGRQVEAGTLPSLAAALGVAGLDAITVDLVAAGEAGGTVDAALGRAADLHREQARLRSEWAARIATGLFYGLAMLVAAYTIVTLYAGYLGQVQETMRDLDTP